MKMVVEIWSDVVCPFCYIGKKKFEKALSAFEHKDDVEVVWRSYQLYPAMKSQPDKTIFEFMAERDGITAEQVKDEYNFINDMAADVDLKYQLDKALLVNTKNAHRLLQIAKIDGKDSIAEELLFHAYFTENKNIDDLTVLKDIAIQMGINSERFSELLLSKNIDDKIEADIYQSNQIGVRGVPFFLMNNDISVSGAQDEQVFVNSLETAWENYHSKSHDKANTIQGNTCSMDGKCE